MPVTVVKLPLESELSSTKSCTMRLPSRTSKPSRARALPIAVAKAISPVNVGHAVARAVASAAAVMVVVCEHGLAVVVEEAGR